MRLTLTGLFIVFSLFVAGQNSDSNLLVAEDQLTTNEVVQSYDEHLLTDDKNIVYPENCSSRTVVTFHDSTYINRINSLNTEMELSFNPIVRDHIEKYVKHGRKQIGKILRDSKYYFPLIEDILEKEGLPAELKYIPIIESALNPNARSRMGATGLWQFMAGTGKAYDLEINNQVDERRDPVKSTYAAVGYMKELYATYGDWNLVIAAYNCGAGNINKAIRRVGGKKDYWAIYPYLPKETRNYVPSFVAAVYIMNYYNTHNIYPAESTYPESMDMLRVNQNVRFKQIADATGLSVDDLRRYNPQFKNDIIPGSRKEYIISLPSQCALAVSDNSDDNILAELSFRSDKVAEDENAQDIFQTDETVTYSVKQAQMVVTYHRVAKGETLQAIAKKNDVTLAELKNWNGLKSNKVRTGSELEIRRIEFVAVQEPQKPQLSEPELLVISVDESLTSDVIDNYLKEIEVESAMQKVWDNEDTYRHIQLLAAANSYEYKTITHTAKKKNIWSRLTNSVNKGVNIALNAVKDWGDSVSDKFRNNRQPKEYLADNNKAETEKAVALAEPVKDVVTESKAEETLLVQTTLSPADLASNDNSLMKIYHKVRIGETVTKIASRYKVSKDDIIAWNNLNTGTARISQRLLIFIPKDNRLAENRVSSLVSL
ncbi:transglycosylase SLT domain-containing protein [Dysgonomonas sp. OttesenSCG-928-D17]|nr:transglycosylase SLT domain-containing protein [Dysgonomonas sp. OttesenSCG-928-D17]